jgi:DNA-binding transcriptional MerR regulator
MTTESTGEWSIQEVARLAGTTSRTLRHYQAEGLLQPSRVAANGYRHYDECALVRLQRILLLRELGLGIPAIRDALDAAPDPTAALRSHLDWLQRERDRLSRQIAAVQHTIETESKGEKIMAEKMFDGFEHTQYQDEVESRWGRDAYASGDAWWRGLSTDARAAWQADQVALAADWSAAAGRGVAADSHEAQGLASRHVAWLDAIPGIPRGEDGAPDPAYLNRLGEMYVEDERFAANYGRAAGAALVRDALQVWTDRHR